MIEECCQFHKCCGCCDIFWAQCLLCKIFQVNLSRHYFTPMSIRLARFACLYWMKRKIGALPLQLNRFISPRLSWQFVCIFFVYILFLHLCLSLDFARKMLWDWNELKTSLGLNWLFVSVLWIFVSCAVNCRCIAALVHQQSKMKKLQQMRWE